MGYTPGSSNFNACFTQITSSKIKHSFWFDWLIFFLFGELILFDWVQLKFSSGGFDLPCHAFFTLFHGMKRRKIPLSKTSVPIFRNSHITLANPTRHRDWTFTIELRLFYTNHKFRNWMFAWVQLFFFLFGEFDFVWLLNSIELNHELILIEFNLVWLGLIYYARQAGNLSWRLVNEISNLLILYHAHVTRFFF